MAGRVVWGSPPFSLPRSQQIVTPPHEYGHWSPHCLRQHMSTEASLPTGTSEGYLPAPAHRPCRPLLSTAQKVSPPPAAVLGEDEELETAAYYFPWCRCSRKTYGSSYVIPSSYTMVNDMWCFRVEVGACRCAATS